MLTALNLLVKVVRKHGTSWLAPPSNTPLPPFPFFPPQPLMNPYSSATTEGDLHEYRTVNEWYLYWCCTVTRGRGIKTPVSCSFHAVAGAVVQPLCVSAPTFYTWRDLSTCVYSHRQFLNWIGHYIIIIMLLLFRMYFGSFCRI